MYIVPASEPQPARIVNNHLLDHWSFYLYLFACSDVVAPEPTWNENREMPERQLCYMYIYMGILHVRDFGKIVLKIGGGGCLGGYL